MAFSKIDLTGTTSYAIYTEALKRALHAYTEGCLNHAAEGEVAKAAFCSGYADALQWALNLPDLLAQTVKEGSDD